MQVQVRRTQPRVRGFAFDHFWNFTAERQQIFQRRLRGTAGPWTEDPILARYKFCNVYRAADRVSQYLIREVAYNPQPHRAADRLFQIVAFRHFSNIATWDSVTATLGHAPTLDDLASDAFELALTEARKRNGGLYTGAFILCATDAYGRHLKHLNHVELFRHMFLRSSLGQSLVEAESLASVFALLKSFPLMGDFMSYQIAIDLNYSAFVNFSENDFTCPGPGAARGLRKIFESRGEYSPAELIMWLVDRQQREFDHRNLAFDGLFGRPLQAIDAQNLLCEVDKYLRVAEPQLTSGRSKIKAAFRPSRTGIDFYFPPKWGLSDKVRAAFRDSTLLPAHEVAPV